MLANGLPRHDLITIKALIQEISYRAPASPNVATPRPPPDMPVKESPGYLTYVGTRKIYAQDLSASMLRMENLRQNGQDWLRIQVSLKP